MAAGVGIAPTSRALQARAHLSKPSSESGAHDRCCPGSFLLDRQVSMLFELMRIGSPRYCPELAGVRARFFTYKDCEPKVVLPQGVAP
jgi:hypothetical protein